MKKALTSSLLFASFLFLLLAGLGVRFFPVSAAQTSAKSSAREIPTFRVDPSWPKLPAGWVLGQVSDIKVDSQDHIWFIHRVSSIKPDQRAHAAPPVLEFDAAGNLLQAWGGPGPGYEWPGSEHGIYVDSKGFVWIGGECRDCFQLLKFTHDGKFVLQIGHAGQRGTMTDTDKFAGPKDVAVDPKTNELFVGDTGAHARVMVFDADTGAFKRMWGGFGNPPTEPGPDEHVNQPPHGGGRYAGKDVDDGGDPPQLTEAHCLRMSNDGLIYVCDGPNKRFQVFTTGGKFVAEKFIDVGRKPKSTATGTLVDRPANEVVDELNNHHETSSYLALSTDPAQRFLYVVDRSQQKIEILDRKSLEVLGEFGGIGREPGKFYIIHSVAVDSHGNLYTTEVNNAGNHRAQKFVFEGLAPAPAVVSSR